MEPFYERHVLKKWGKDKDESMISSYIWTGVCVYANKRVPLVECSVDLEMIACCRGLFFLLYHVTGKGIEEL